jgi:predicted Rossmann fold flavoprotein
MSKKISEHFDVVVLGAGAAGLLCAATAAQRGRKVLVLEKSNKAGKKILMSGGGRCNFTNYFVEPDHFISNNSHFCKSALKRYTQWDFIAMVDRHAISYEERKHSQLFCLHSAADILSMLVKECQLAGVTIRNNALVSSIQHSNVDDVKPSYTLEMVVGKGESCRDETLSCTSLVVATGALSIPTLGGSGAGYDIAQQFNIPLTSRRAGLVPFTFSDSIKPLCERLSGLAAEVEVSCNGRVFRESLLFTHRGMSGPAILQISNYWQLGDEISINLLPDIDANDWLLTAKQQQGASLLRTLLASELPKSLVLELQTMTWPGLANTAIAEFTDTKLEAIGNLLNDWRLKPSGTEGYRTAEVTLGGVDTDYINSKNMEAKEYSGLYFVGEVLDVSGHLGGFNFQWAWSSGYAAGLSA